MILIEHQELASAQASITFSDIPQDYTDLYLVLSLRGSQSATAMGVNMTFNNSAVSWSGRRLYGTGSSVSSSTNPAGTAALFTGSQSAATSTSNTFGNGTIYIPNYTSSNYKSVSTELVGENNATAIEATIVAGLWSSTSAITSITLSAYDGLGNFVQYSSATLYGITTGSDGVTSVS